MSSLTFTLSFLSLSVTLCPSFSLSLFHASQDPTRVEPLGVSLICGFPFDTQAVTMALPGTGVCEN